MYHIVWKSHIKITTWFENVRGPKRLLPVGYKKPALGLQLRINLLTSSIKKQYLSANRFSLKKQLLLINWKSICNFVPRWWIANGNRDHLAAIADYLDYFSRVSKTTVQNPKRKTLIKVRMKTNWYRNTIPDQWMKEKASLKLFLNKIQAEFPVSTMKRIWIVPCTVNNSITVE